jgi:rhodanese-related sulfurtransferase
MTGTAPVAQIGPTAASALAADGALLLDVRNLAGGMKAWAEQSLPITTDGSTPHAVG